MKKHYLVLLGLLTTSLSFGQQTITSIQNGNASSPLTWDCFCFPGTNDHIIINHHVGMDVDWLVNNGGSISINSSGSLTQVGTHSIAFVDNGSSLSVDGSFTMENISISGGATGATNGTTVINNAFYIGPNSDYNNVGNTTGIDSILVEGTLYNAGVLMTGNALVTGEFTNAGDVQTDSLGITGVFTMTNGNLYCSAFGNTGTGVLQTGTFTTETDFFNAGSFSTSANTIINCGNDFFSGDTIGGSAVLQHDGMLGVMNDLYFSDAISGSGMICVNNYTVNAGTITGTLDFCDATGSMFDLDLGTISGTTTYCNPGCTAQLDEIVLNWNVFPNPANDQFTVIGAADVNGVEVYALSGIKVADLQLVNGKCAVEELSTGTYLVVLKGVDNALPVRIVIE